jgi:sterol desaturase/sphingolipid hydroxylase (fatty acid hydroxylase superfamily)
MATLPFPHIDVIATIHPVAHAALKLAMVSVLIQPLELLFPVRPQKLLYKGVWTDVGWYFLHMLAGGLTIVPAMALIGTAIHAVLPPAVTAPFAGLPLPVRLPLAFFLYEAGLYWGHRWSHHPVDVVLTRAVGMIPLFALGLDTLQGPTGARMSAAFVFVGGLWSYFIHANVRWRLGPLEWLVATPFFHHWHHTRHDHIDRNYATVLTVMDRLFGTLYMPKAWPEAYGTDTPVPESLGGQLLFPVIPPRRGPVGPVMPEPASGG